MMTNEQEVLELATKMRIVPIPTAYCATQDERDALRRDTILAFAQAIRDQEAAKVAMLVDGESVAKMFHDTYEHLAPSFGYETRTDTRQFNADSANGKLMIAVCEAVIGDLLQEAKEQIEYLDLENHGLRSLLAVKDAALYRLSILGNGSRPGNSEGNVIAQEALSATAHEAEAFIREKQAEAVKDAMVLLLNHGEDHDWRIMAKSMGNGSWAELRNAKEV